ncbi:MAG TPA: acyloxyacyl hydrolase [Humisphaera sp.]|jgi:opacity protein-like surface antigen|nr:acyloxyacyl hydrolase [Humisphaera sp.]
MSVAALADPPTTQPITDFTKGTASFSVVGAYAHSFDSSEARIETVAVGGGYYFLDHMAINLELAGFWVQQPGPDAQIAEANLLLRHHLLVIDRFSFLIDVGGGISYANERTPYPDGTNFNFTLQTGLGATWRLKDNMYLLGGVRYLHFSNAQIDGKERNPSINATEGYFGLLFTF